MQIKVHSAIEDEVYRGAAAFVRILAAGVKTEAAVETRDRTLSSQHLDRFDANSPHGAGLFTEIQLLFAFIEAVRVLEVA